MNPVYGAVAGIDVHKRMLAVVVAVLGEQEIQYQQRKFGTSYGELEGLSEWLRQQQVGEIAMESTAQYWRPVWLALEGRVSVAPGAAAVHAGAAWPRSPISPMRPALCDGCWPKI